MWPNLETTKERDKSQMSLLLYFVNRKWNSTQRFKDPAWRIMATHWNAYRITVLSQCLQKTDVCENEEKLQCRIATVQISQTKDTKQLHHHHMHQMVLWPENTSFKRHQRLHCKTYILLGFTSNYFLTLCCECHSPSMIFINKPCARPKVISE